MDKMTLAQRNDIRWPDVRMLAGYIYRFLNEYVDCLYVRKKLENFLNRPHLIQSMVTRKGWTLNQYPIYMEQTLFQDGIIYPGRDPDRVFTWDKISGTRWRVLSSKRYKNTIALELFHRLINDDIY